MSKSNSSLINSGLIEGVGAFLFWGLISIYWKQFETIKSFELFGHRVVWGFVTALFLCLLTGKMKEVISIFKDKKKFLIILFTSTLIFSNWFVFVWAVTNNYLVEVSIGYFLCPLMNVTLGVLVLKEKLNRLQYTSVVLAMIAICILFFTGVGTPWISLFLASSFAIYGMVRKLVKVSAMAGFLIECGLSAIPMFIYMGMQLQAGSLQFVTASNSEQILAICAGIATLIPLALFNIGVVKLELSTIGLLQYIAPSLQLVLGVIIYKEEFTNIHFISFSLIWSALVIFSWQSIRKLISIREKAHA